MFPFHMTLFCQLVYNFNALNNDVKILKIAGGVMILDHQIYMYLLNSNYNSLLTGVDLGSLLPCSRRRSILLDIR